MIPGGGVKRHESYVEGAYRELREETGIETELTHFYTYQQQREYKDDTVQCFFGDVDTPKVRIDNFEIIDYGWFQMTALPHDCAPSVDRIIQAWQSTRT